MIEVELKAHIDDISVARKHVELLDGVSEAVEMFKSDIYFVQDHKSRDTSLFRLREENGKGIVTRKHKRLIDAVEVNDEIEFSVSDVAAFKAFCKSMHYQVYVRKEKRGVTYRYGNMSIELWEVLGLGSFMELEILLPDAARDDTQVLNLAREQLLQMVDRLHIGRDAIEERYYMDLLRSQQNLDT